MEQNYETRGENLRKRKKSKSTNNSGKFLPLPSEIVALRFLRILPLTTLPFTLPTWREKRNLDPPFPPFHGSFFKNDCNICYRQQRCSAETFALSQFFRSGREVNISGLTDFLDPVQGLKGGRKFILARPHFGEYLALAIEHNRNAQRQRSPQARLSQVDPYFQDFATACFSRFSLLLKKQHSTGSSCKCHLLKQFLFHILHVTQSRVSMGLTVSRISVKKTSCQA